MLTGQSINGVPGTISNAGRFSAITGLLTGLTAGQPFFSLRFNPSGAGLAATRLAILRLQLAVTIVTPFTAAQEILAQAFLGRGYTGNASGGTAIVFTTNFQSLNSANYQTASQIADCRISTTGTLTAGTGRTLDGQSLVAVSVAQVGAAAAATNAIYDSDSVDFTGTQRLPQVLVANEGIECVMTTGMGAAGTVRAVVDFDWVEFQPTFS